MSEKQCTKCNEVKPFSEFYKKRNGLASFCKCCSRLSNKLQYAKNQNSRVNYAKQYREENKDKISESAKKRYIKNKSDIAIDRAQYYQKNKEYILSQKAKYRTENRERINESQYKYKKNKIKTDHTFKLVENLRRRVLLAIKGTGKSATTLELLGCSADTARQHLEDQFTEGMCWDNHGLYGWHIDHIIPCASFDMTDPEQQKECFHYTNLQPLWAEDNLRKSDKLNYNQ